MAPASFTATPFRLREQGAGTDVPATMTVTGNTRPSTRMPTSTRRRLHGHRLRHRHRLDRQPARRRRHLELHDSASHLQRHRHDRRRLRRRYPGRLTYVSETGNGEVTLRPTVGAEFSGGPALPSGWSSGTWESQGGGTGGSATVTGGSAPRQWRLRRYLPPLTAPAARSSSGRTSAAATSPTSASPTTSTTTGRSSSIRGDGQHQCPHERRRSPAGHQPSKRADRLHAQLPDRVGRERGPLLRRRQPRRHPLGELRLHPDAPGRQRLQRRWLRRSRLIGCT